MTVVLETDRLLVRLWQASDAEAAFEILGDPDVTRYLGETGDAFADHDDDVSAPWDRGLDRARVSRVGRAAALAVRAGRDRQPAQALPDACGTYSHAPRP